MVRDRRDPARTRALVGMGYPQGVEGDDEAMKRRGFLGAIFGIATAAVVAPVATMQKLVTAPVSLARDDLLDLITIIHPTTTPFLSLLRVEKTLPEIQHDWLDTLDVGPKMEVI